MYIFMLKYVLSVSKKYTLLLIRQGGGGGRGKKERAREHCISCHTFPTVAPPSTPVPTTLFAPLNPHQ
jgi:hypothetical protein